MILYVDADACPGVVSDLILNSVTRLAAQGKNIKAVYVSNKPLRLPLGELVEHQLVSAGADIADGVIAEQAIPGDLVITQDIPLAHILVHKQVTAISPYGVVFNNDNIGERKGMRDVLSMFRETGAITSGPKPFDANAKRAFANALDRELSRVLKTST